MTFAAQAAMVIANARRYQDEQRARNDLETLINISPVGVAVFDAKTGAPLSFNRETRRILEGLWKPDQSPEQFLESLTVRRAEGREASLRELSMAQALSLGETVRAEGILFRVLDGRSVTALVNATPIRSEDGESESFVVTLQVTPFMPRLRNPSLRTERFRGSWNESQYLNFREKFKIYNERINAAYEEPDARRSIAMWRVLFGDRFG